MTLEEVMACYSHVRRLPGDRFVGITPLTYDRARIISADRWSVDDGW